MALAGKFAKCLLHTTAGFAQAPPVIAALAGIRMFRTLGHLSGLTKPCAPSHSAGAGTGAKLFPGDQLPRARAFDTNPRPPLWS